MQLPDGRTIDVMVAEEDKDHPLVKLMEQVEEDRKSGYQDGSLWNLGRPLADSERGSEEAASTKRCPHGSSNGT